MLSYRNIRTQLSGLSHEGLRVLTDEGLLVVAGHVVPRDPVLVPIVVNGQAGFHRHLRTINYNNQFKQPILKVYKKL